MPRWERTQKGDGERIGCNCPEGCILEKKVKVEEVKDDGGNYVRVICSVDNCKEVPFVHKECFESWEQALLKQISRCQYVRNWSPKDQAGQLWSGKGYNSSFYYVRTSCRCACGGYLKKELVLEQTVERETKQKKASKKKENSRPDLNRPALRHGHCGFRRTPGISASACVAPRKTAKVHNNMDQTASVTPRYYPVGYTLQRPDTHIPAAHSKRLVSLPEMSISKTMEGLDESGDEQSDAQIASSAEDTDSGEWQVVSRAKAKQFTEKRKRPGKIRSPLKKTTRRSKWGNGQKRGEIVRRMDHGQQNAGHTDLDNGQQMRRETKTLEQVRDVGQMGNDMGQIQPPVEETQLQLHHRQKQHSVFYQKNAESTDETFGIEDHVRGYSADIPFVYRHASLTLQNIANLFAQIKL